ncbi:flagellar assembly protein FliX [Rhodoplanes roseus]|uniref:Flagellar assembly regulator FliX n=1 Tax=Rhodoplanes roseus TaxID=29409 RepID=A0A327L5C7_9BRAD|nr:flagellar assembly protein FliX [Rhodoplanes roseus]RAI45404.1 flagellar assembly regulator FliX [Rhodoplanes roseus]
MRITGPNGTTTTGSASSVRRTGSGTFMLPDSSGSPAPSATAASRPLTGIDALIALQGVEDPAERRRRAVVRGRSALDILDEMKLALLAGNLDPNILARLGAIAAGLKESTGDPGLDSVLAEIELRVEVELAKMKPLSRL